MKETQTTPVRFPPGRYGRRREPRRRRWLTWLVALVVAVGGVAVALKLYRQYGDAPYQERLVNVTQITDSSITMTFEVKTENGTASCTVIARNRAGAEVGRATVPVAGSAPDGWVRVQHELPTAGRAFVGEVTGCGPG